MKTLLTVFLLFCFSSTSFSLTLAEKKELQKWQIELGKKQEYSQKHCGVEIPGTLDESLVTPFMEAGKNAVSFCEEVYGVMGNMCSSDPDLTKKAIAGQIKKVTCKLGKQDEKLVELKGSELIFTFGVNAKNLKDAVKSYLENNLK